MQLVPVTGKALFQAKQIKEFDARGHMADQLFDKVVKFDEVMRQKGESQKRFREILTAMADGTFNESHWKDLEKRY